MSALRTAASVTVTIAVLFVVLVFFDGRHHLYDLTTNDSLTLTPQTRDVVRAVRDRVQITAFIAEADAGRSEAAALLERYRRANHRIHYRVVDPADAPTLVRALAIDPTVDALAASRRDYVARAPTVTEQDVTSVLAQVVRRVSATLCFTSGHGENDTQSEDDEGLAAATRLLAGNGYTSTTVDLLTETTIPDECDGLVVAAPTAPLGDASDAIGDYLRANGRAVLLSDPASTVDLSLLLKRYGLAVDRGIAVDPDRDAHLPDDPATVIVRRYSSTSPVVRGLPPTLFPGSGAVILDRRVVGGLSTTSLVQTGGGGFLERQPEHAGRTPGEDRDGPITLMAAADRSRVRGPNTIDRSRVVAAGDVDFATNAFIAEGGNARLLVQAVDWVMTDEDLVPLNANLPAYRPLALTSGRTTSARVLSVGVIPGAFLLAGLLVWVARRRA